MKKDTNAQLREAVRKIISEVGPEAGRVDSSIMTEQIRERLGDMFMEIAMDAVYNVEEKIMVEAAKIMNQHNMTDTQFGKTTSRSLRDQIDEFEQGSGDDKELLMRECASDIEQALDKFATQLGEYIVHIIGPSDR